MNSSRYLFAVDLELTHKEIPLKTASKKNDCKLVGNLTTFIERLEQENHPLSLKIVIKSIPHLIPFPRTDSPSKPNTTKSKTTPHQTTYPSHSYPSQIFCK